MSLAERIYIPQISFRRLTDTHNLRDPLPPIKPEKITPFYKTHTETVLKECAQMYMKTDDAFELERYKEYVPVFLYCDMQKGGSKHHIIEKIFKETDDEQRSVNPYVYSKDTFEVFQTNDGKLSFPIAFPSNAPPLTTIPRYMYEPRSGIVKGRLYFIPSHLLNLLDNYKQNGVLFKRIQTRVHIPYRIQWPERCGVNMTEENTELYGVWMYIGIKDFWDECPRIYLKRCDTKNHIERKRGNLLYHSTPKTWMGNNRIYYLFNAWEINNK